MPSLGGASHLALRNLMAEQLRLGLSVAGWHWP